MRTLFLVVIGLTWLAAVFPSLARAEQCGELHFGGLLNANNSSTRLHPRRLTFARQTGKLIGSTKRTWNTYVRYDLSEAFFDLKKLGGEGAVIVTLCAHDHEKDAGRGLMEFRLSANAPQELTTHTLSGLKDKYVSVVLRGEDASRQFQYEIRLRRPTQGQLWRATPNSLGPVRGFADLHNHQASDLANGGEFNSAYVHGYHGGPLHVCDGTHSTVRKLFNAGTGEHRAFPSFDAKQPNRWWPHYADGSHAQSQIDQLKQAFDDGLRVFLATAVSNQALCVLTSQSDRRIRQCDDMDSAKAQLKAMRDFDEKHDWYQLARDPWEARQIIKDGKLAVVLGVEVSNLMPNAHGNWQDQLDELYDMGVRSIELAHEADSRFSGNAHQHGRMFKALNNQKRLTRPLQLALAPMLKHAAETIQAGESATPEDFFEYLYKTRNPKFCDPEYQNQGIDCNKVGLSFEGETLVRKLMAMRMLIPLDHISRKSRKQVYELAKENDYYPLIATHSRPDAVLHPKERSGNSGTHEYMLTDGDLAMIRSTGGLLGLRTADNAMLEIPGCINRQLTCFGSTQSLAQNLCWLAKSGVAVALGTDFSGPVTMTSPQFSHASAATQRWDRLPAACPKNVHLGFVTPFGYEEQYRQFEPQQRSGSDLDYGVRGLAHTGYSRPLIDEMRALGAPIRETRLMHSAESFLRSWERAYRRDGRLSDAQYRAYMATARRDYDAPLPPRAYDEKLAGLYKTCAKLKAEGSKKCDSIADWKQMIIDNEKKSQTCPLGKNRVAYNDGVLYCQNAVPKAIRTSDCSGELVDGRPGSLDELAGYCAWNQLNKNKPHYFVRRLKENKCPTGMTLIKAKKDSVKPYCKALVAMPISAAKCPEWGGRVSDVVSGYCVQDKNTHFHARKLKGFDKYGQRKCPTGLKKIVFDIKSDELFCKALVATPISADNCRQEKGGRLNVVDGYCALDKGTYSRVWKIKGHNRIGEDKCPTPYFKVPVAGSPDELYCQAKPSFPIAADKCPAEGGSKDRIKGYCAFDKGGWYLIRKLKGHNKAGDTKCPNLLTRVDLKPGSGIKYCKSALAISKKKCDKENGVISDDLSGYCARQESGYVRVWKLKGFDKYGDKKFKCPVGLFKVTVQDDELFCKKAISNKITTAECRADDGNPTRLTSYCSWKKDFYFLVRPIADNVSLGKPDCPAGYSYEIRNPLNKDRCKKTIEKTTALKCKLLVTDKAKNWTGPHAQSGTDECRSKKGKKPKGVKCPLGYKLQVNSAADRCVKTTYDYRDPSCPAGARQKSQSGADICLQD